MPSNTANIINPMKAAPMAVADRHSSGTAQRQWRRHQPGLRAAGDGGGIAFTV